MTIKAQINPLVISYLCPLCKEKMTASKFSSTTLSCDSSYCPSNKGDEYIEYHLEDEPPTIDVEVREKKS